MPLVKRAIEPVFVSQGELDKRVNNELEGVAVKSLAGIIKELSSLAKHADNLFGELVFEAINIYQRSAVLTQRIDELYQLYQHWRENDSTIKDDIKVEDIVAMNHFRSSRKEDQEILSRDTLPTAIQEVRSKCEPPPALNEFTRYRDDQKVGLSFYTDSACFYRHWVEGQNQLLEMKERRECRRRRKKGHKPKPMKEIRAAQKKVFIGADAEFRDNQAHKFARHRQVPVNIEQQNEPTSEPFAQTECRPKHLAPDQDVHALSTQPMNAYSTPPSNSPQMVPKPTALPPHPFSYPTSFVPVPPPQPYPDEKGYHSVPTPPQETSSAPSQNAQPPPVSNSPTIPSPPLQNLSAPPPPPVDIPVPPPPPLVNTLATPPPPVNIPAPPVPGRGWIGGDNKPSPSTTGNRSDLLSAIRSGKQLRKVERTQVEKNTTQYGSDVASILARRKAVETSDSESGSEYQASDSDWSD